MESKLQELLEKLEYAEYNLGVWLQSYPYDVENEEDEESLHQGTKDAELLLRDAQDEVEAYCKAHKLENIYF